MTKPTDEARDATRTNTPRGRAAKVARLAKITAATAVLGVAAWSAAPLVLDGPEPAAIFSEAEFPSAPPESENGWAMVVRGLTPAAPRPPKELQALVGAGSEHPPPALLAGVRGERERVRAWLAEPATAKAVAESRRAFAAPRFADACRVDPATSCAWIPVLDAHRLVAFAAAADAADGAWTPAVTSVARLVRADLDAASTARTLLGQLVALSNLDRALALFAEITTELRAEPARVEALDEPARAALRDAKAALAAFDPAAIGLRRAVVHEYVLARKAPDDFARSERIVDRAMAVHLDRRAYQTDVNRRFAEIVRAVEHPTAAAPAPPPLELGATTWLTYNPVAALLNRGTAVEYNTGVLAKSRAARARIEARVEPTKKALDELTR